MQEEASQATMLPENGQRTKDNLTLTPLLQSHTTARQAPTATKVECVMKVPHIPTIFVPSRSNMRATSHTRLRTRDHYTSSTLIGGKGGAGPSSLHTTLH